MKQRNRDYIARQKANCAMRHPADLKSLLVAEFDSSRNLLVKKDILKMINQLEQPLALSKNSNHQ